MGRGVRAVRMREIQKQVNGGVMNARLIGGAVAAALQ
jgi:hypothetical protein